MSTLKLRIEALEQQLQGRQGRIEDMLLYMDNKKKWIEQPAYFDTLNWEPLGKWSEGILKRLANK